MRGTSGASPFWSTISARTAAQGSLSSLSMAEQIARVRRRRHAADAQHRIQQRAVVHLDAEVAQGQTLQDLHRHLRSRTQQRPPLSTHHMVGKRTGYPAMQLNIQPYVSGLLDWCRCTAW